MDLGGGNGSEEALALEVVEIDGVEHEDVEVGWRVAGVAVPIDEGQLDVRLRLGPGGVQDRLELIRTGDVGVKGYTEAGGAGSSHVRDCRGRGRGGDRGTTDQAAEVGNQKNDSRRRSGSGKKLQTTLIDQRSHEYPLGSEG